MKINKNIQVLLYGSNIWYLGEGMLGPLFVIFAERIGGDIFDITWAWATYLIVSGILNIVVGKGVKTQQSKERIMILGYALNALFTFGYLLVSSPWHLFVVQMGLGVASALANPTWSALYAQYEDKKYDTLEWGLAYGYADIITGIAIIIGGLIITHFSFTALFIIMGCIQVGATLYQAQILKTSAPSPLVEVKIKADKDIH